MKNKSSPTSDIEIVFRTDIGIFKEILIIIIWEQSEGRHHNILKKKKQKFHWTEQVVRFTDNRWTCAVIE